MNKIEITIYDYYDMIALEEMKPEDVVEVLKHVYRKHINKYIFPDNKICKYSEGEYDIYEIQCAFDLAYKYLGRIEEDDEKI